ncbi:MAG: hypothetical protein AB9842_03745 [Bacteroidales bacterium]
MKRIFILIILTFYFSSGFCQGFTGHKVHKLLVKEVLHTTSYTYLKVEEDTSLSWIAVPRMEASAGETYYSSGGMEMRNFASKELKRTFPLIYFMDFVSKTPEGTIKKESPPKEKSSAGMPDHGMKSKVAKARLSVEPAVGGIRIAELFKNKEKYSGKTVKIRGQVIKYNERILGKNWVHIQDGTSYDDEYDLVVTTTKPLKVGDKITFKGTISLNKDFGSGYSFTVLMEDAEIIQ